MTTGFSTIRADGVVRKAGQLEYAYLSGGSAQAHAANLAMMPNGRLGCVWFGGTQEGVPDIGVWFSTLDMNVDDAAGSAHGASRIRRWSEPVRLSNDQTRSEQNPVLFVDGNQVWLLYTAQVAGNQDTAEVRQRVSHDSGKTWSPVTTLFSANESGGVFVRQRPVRVGGRILVPTFRCMHTEGQKWDGSFDDSAVYVSSDGGNTWDCRVVPDSVGAVHMDINVLPSGQLVSLFRSRRADWVYLSKSDDDGLTWSVPQPTALPNNNSSIQSTVLNDGRLALIYNHRQADSTTTRRDSLYDEIDDDGLVEDATRETLDVVKTDKFSNPRNAFWGTPRAPMSLAASSDGGLTWSPPYNLEIGDGYCLTNNSRDGLNREYSYPSILQSPDGMLQIAYTYFRQAIKYVSISPDSLQTFDPSDGQKGCEP